MTTLLLLVGSWLGYLAVESLLLRRWQRAIPLRAAVTGTRGKSSVVRMLAATLREDGWRVLAKTTGSETVLILPDGKERRLRRRGRATILEQRGVLRLGARLGVDAVIAEVMSIHPENHAVEARRLLNPDLVLVTNFRVDHLEAQGGSSGDVARVLSQDVPRGARVLVPDWEWEPAFEAALVGSGALVSRVPLGAVAGGPGGWRSTTRNRSLVRAAARLLGVEGDAVERGLAAPACDMGSLRVWRYGVDGDGEGREWTVVSAFGVNDPESTLEALEEVMEEMGSDSMAPGPVGLLSLRKDRGDRTALWAEAMKAGALSRFRSLYVRGFHATAFRRKLRGLPGPGVTVLPAVAPERATRWILERERGRGDGTSRGECGVLFGFGNLGGFGEDLVRHWETGGRPVSPGQEENPDPPGPDGPGTPPEETGGAHGT